jgi:hypothetical protein
MGRKPSGKTAMTAAERQRRRRERLKPEKTYAALCAAWEVSSRAQRTRFLRDLRATTLAAKKALRAEKRRQLAETLRRENERRGADMTPVGPGERRIVGWLAGLPIWSCGAKPAASTDHD